MAPRRATRDSGISSYAESDSDDQAHSSGRDHEYIVIDDDDDETEDELSQDWELPTKSSAVAQARDQNNSRTVKGRLSSNDRESKEKRDAFFKAKAEYFLPLLPESNYISRMTEQQRAVAEYEDLKEAPRGVIATLKPYQLQGLSFLVYLHRNGVAGVLGDEMGLGKTLQTLSLIQWIKENEKPDGRPHLVICPLSVLNSWLTEAQRWTPQLRVARFHGPPAVRDRVKQAVTNSQRRGTPNNRLDVVVTTYECFLSEQSWFKRSGGWRYAVLDEGHKIKNHGTQISRALHSIGAQNRLILTGTPLQNNMVELWALLHWLYPDVFTENTMERFKSSFDIGRGQVDRSFMELAQRLLELIMLRRIKKSLGEGLKIPPKTEVLLFVPLTALQRAWYKKLLTKVDSNLLKDIFHDAANKEATDIKEEALIQDWKNRTVEEMEEAENAGVIDAELEHTKAAMANAISKDTDAMEGKGAWRKLMNLLVQLRKCCSHPYILPDVVPEGYVLGEHLVRASGKFIALDKIVERLVIREKKKILIFSGYTAMLNVVEDLLNLRGGDGTNFRYCRLDGSTPRARRNLTIRLFSESRSSYQVMLISTRAGGLGINLTAASDAVMLDEDWNPQITLQAEARCHRIGQTKPVTIYKLCTQGTIEEQMIGRIQKKLYLSAKVTESMRSVHTAGGSDLAGRAKGSNGTDNDAPHLATSELMSLVRRGAQAISRPDLDVDDMCSWDYETLLTKCRDQRADMLGNDEVQDSARREEEERKWLEQMERVQCTVLDGKEITKKRKSGKRFDGIEVLDLSREDRRKGKETTVMIDGYAVSKSSANCAEWEAVPNMAGKDPNLAEPERSSKNAKAFEHHQAYCQQCLEGGQLVTCAGCPRSFHRTCRDHAFARIGHPADEDEAAADLSIARNAGFPLRLQRATFQPGGRGISGRFCPQHACRACGAKTAEAGGLLFRCRWCPRAFCDECLDFDGALLEGEELPEMALLGVQAGAERQAFWVSCHACVKGWEVDAKEKKLVARARRVFERQYQERFGQEWLKDPMAVGVDDEEDGDKPSKATRSQGKKRKARELSEEAPSLTDGPSFFDGASSSPSGVATPDSANHSSFAANGRALRASRGNAKTLRDSLRLHIEDTSPKSGSGAQEDIIVLDSENDAMSPVGAPVKRRRLLRRGV